MRAKVPANGTPLADVPILGSAPCAVARCLVVVTIRPVGVVSLDGQGRTLHCRWEFVAQDSPSKGLSPVRGISDTTGGRSPIQIESDEGSFWLPASAKLALVGGIAGDEYEVEAFYVEREAPPSESVFGLTTSFPAGAGPIDVIRPPWHTRLRLVVGTVTVNGVASVPGNDPIPLSAASMTANPGTIYRTESIL